jgi:hypothetical protein
MERNVQEEDAQREAEKNALRKVRRTLDDIEAGETEQRQWRSIVVAVSVALFLLGAGLLAGLYLAAKDVPRGAPVQLPGKVAPKN